MEAVEIYHQLPPPPPTCIRVFGEGDDNELCFIHLDEDDMPFGKDVGQLKALICSHPNVESLFPGITPTGIVLRGHVGRGLLKDNVHVGGGQTVHMCSGKGVELDKEDEITAYLPHDMAAAIATVYWKGDAYVVPRGRKLAAYVCELLKLDPDRHFVSKQFDHYVLKCAEPVPRTLPLVSINNDNNDVVEVDEFKAKWDEDDKKTAFLMPDGSTFWYTPSSRLGDGIAIVLPVICEHFKWDQRDCTITHCRSLLSALHFFPGDKYEVHYRLWKKSK